MGAPAAALGVYMNDPERINLIFPWRLMELDCLAYRQEIEEISGRNRGPGKSCGETGMYSDSNQNREADGRKMDDFMYRLGSTD